MENRKTCYLCGGPWPGPGDTSREICSICAWDTYKGSVWPQSKMEDLEGWVWEREFFKTQYQEPVWTTIQQLKYCGYSLKDFQYKVNEGPIERDSQRACYICSKDHEMSWMENAKEIKVCIQCWIVATSDLDRSFWDRYTPRLHWEGEEWAKQDWANIYKEPYWYFGINPASIPPL